MSRFPDQILTDHLTSNQIDDHLIGNLAPNLAAHLAVCALCADRVAAAASPIASFRQLSTAWSERRSATLPIPVPIVHRPVWQRYMAWAAASLSLAFGLAFLNAGHQFYSNAATQNPAPSIAAPQSSVGPLTAAVTTAPLPNQVSADNHLLQAINASLNSPTDSTADVGLTATSANHTGPLTSIQD